jgi:hypothetical protein
MKPISLTLDLQSITYSNVVLTDISNAISINVTAGTFSITLFSSALKIGHKPPSTQRSAEVRREDGRPRSIFCAKPHLTQRGLNRPRSFKSVTAEEQSQIFPYLMRIDQQMGVMRIGQWILRRAGLVEITQVQS